jgi:hypothetical protein
LQVNHLHPPFRQIISKIGLSIKKARHTRRALIKTPNATMILKIFSIIILLLFASIDVARQIQGAKTYN